MFLIHVHHQPVNPLVEVRMLCNLHINKVPNTLFAFWVVLQVICGWLEDHSLGEKCVLQKVNEVAILSK